MMRSLLVAAFALSVGIAPLAAQEKVVVGGAGAMGDAVEALTKAYKQKNPSDNVELIKEPMSTTGGIEGAKSGRLTVGIVSRPLNEKEKKEGLAYRPAARIPVVIGVHKSLPVSNLSDPQVCDIFSGKIKSWKDVGGSDGKIVVLARKKDDTAQDIFREKMDCFKDLKLASDAVMLVRGTEVLDSLHNRPGLIGATVAGAHVMERPNIKPLAISGAAPALDNVKSGKYRYYLEAGFVTLGEPKGTAARFVEFVGGPEGEKILEKYGMAGAR